MIAVLDGVRAFACIIVIAYHINRFTVLDGVWSPSTVGPLAGSFLLSGASGVTLFFVLSGFLLFMPYAQSLLFDTPWPAAKRFYLRRVFRILPGYYVSLAFLIVVAYPQYFQPEHWHELLLFLVFLMDSTRVTYQAINGPFWTLAVEWQFYMLIPLFALLFRKVVQKGSVQRRLYTLWSCLAVLVIWGIATRYWGRSWELAPNQPMWLPEPLHRALMFLVYGESGKYFEDFAVGMFVGSLYSLSTQQPEHKLVLWLRRSSRWLWALGILFLFYLMIWSALPGARAVGPFIGPHNWLAEIVFAIGFGICVTALLFGPQDLKSVLEWYPLRWLGTLSYGMYIWHLPILLCFITYVLPYVRSWRNLVVYSLYWICILCLVIPFSYLFYRFIEWPWIEFGGRLTSKGEKHIERG